MQARSPPEWLPRCHPGPIRLPARTALPGSLVDVRVPDRLHVVGGLIELAGTVAIDAVNAAIEGFGIDVRLQRRR